MDQTETQLARDPATGRMTVSGGSRAQARSTAAADAVVRVLSEAGEPLTARAIENAVMELGLPKASVRDAVANLRAMGQVLGEVGAHNAHLHRLSPISSPVRQTSPQIADDDASQFAARLLGGEVANKAKENKAGSSPRRTEFSGLSDAQQQVLEELREE